MWTKMYVITFESYLLFGRAYRTYNITEITNKSDCHLRTTKKINLTRVDE